MKSYLFIGTESFKWGPANFDPPIALCKKYRITGLLVKAYEITQGLWYGGMSGFDAIYKHITGAGLECVPYGFFYGGAGLPSEANIGLLFMQKYGRFCMDSESAFDGQSAWGQKLASIWSGHPGELWVSTWANPADHKWLGIIEALRPHVQVWMPQVYSDKLAGMALAQWPKVQSIQPTVGIVGDGDVNAGALHVNMFGGTDLSIWEYQEGIAHGDRLQAIMHVFGAQPVAQTAQPAPVAQPTQGIVTMSGLANFPMVAERTTITGDSHPSENAGLNCVPSSILAGVMYLLGILQLGGKFTPDSFKDAVYGQGTTGGESPSAYVAYLSKEFGITLSSFKGTPASLVAEAHRQIAAGHPVIFTIPNPYGNPNYTHVCVFYGTGQRTLIAMDPWIVRGVTKSDAAWASVMQYNEIWIMSKIGETMTPLTIADVKSYFTANADGSWTRIDPKTGVALLDSLNKPITLSGPLKDDWCNLGTAVYGLVGLPVGNAYQPDPARPEILEQEFERCKRRLDVKHAEDSPPFAGHVYSTHIEALYSAQTKLEMALDQLQATQKLLTAAQAAAPSIQPPAGASPESAYVAAVQQVGVKIKEISAVIDPLNTGGKP